MEKKDISFNLLEIFNSETFNDDYIKKQIPTKDLEDFKQEISNNIADPEISKETTIKRIKRTINRENTEDKRKISKIKAQNFTSTLLNYFNIHISDNIINNPLKLKEIFENEEEFDKLFPNCLKFEKQIVIIIDNYSVHKTYLSKIICKILNIKLIYLPKYSPFLNPIEQLWRTIKNILHRNPIRDIEYLIEEVFKLFNKLVDKPSFIKKWVAKYITKK